MPTYTRAQNSESTMTAGSPTSGIVHNVNGVPQLSRKFVARRISEGETGRLKEELKCQACGKGYKHVSSLAKHLWEHTPEWNVTSKLLISKHQQVQLLEAASILVSMNEEDEEGLLEEGSTDSGDASGRQVTPGSAPVLSSDDSSPSPEADGEPTAPPMRRSLSPLPESPTRPIATPASTQSPEVPVTSARSIQKHTMARRRFSVSNQAISASPAIASSLVHMAVNASPLPESWIKDEDNFLPRRSSRRSTFSRMHEIDDGHDGLQDPPQDSTSASVFGEMDD